MRAIPNEKPTKGAENHSGTVVTLRAILSQHPEHHRFEFQTKAHEVRKLVEAQKDQDTLEFSEDIYQWLLSKLQNASYQGMIAGKLIESFLDAEPLEDKPITH